MTDNFVPNNLFAVTAGGYVWQITNATSGSPIFTDISPTDTQKALLEPVMHFGFPGSERLMTD